MPPICAEPRAAFMASAPHGAWKSCSAAMPTPGSVEVDAPHVRHFDVGQPIGLVPQQYRLFAAGE